MGRAISLETGGIFLAVSSSNIARGENKAVVYRGFYLSLTVFGSTATEILHRPEELRETGVQAAGVIGVQNIKILWKGQGWLEHF